MMRIVPSRKNDSYFTAYGSFCIGFLCGLFRLVGVASRDRGCQGLVVCVIQGFGWVPYCTSTGAMKNKTLDEEDWRGGK